MAKLDTEQEQVLRMLAKIEKELPNGVTLTFAVDNLIDTMDKSKWDIFINIIHELIAGDYLAKHTEKETGNGVPFWLELTDQGRE